MPQIAYINFRKSDSEATEGFGLPNCGETIVLESVLHREITESAFVSIVWAAISLAIGAIFQIDVLLPVLWSLAIFAAAEASRIWHGTPLNGSNSWRIAKLSVWAAIGYATFVVGLWYLLPISLAFLGIILFDENAAHRSAPARVNAKAYRRQLG